MNNCCKSKNNFSTCLMILLIVICMPLFSITSPIAEEMRGDEDNTIDTEQKPFDYYYDAAKMIEPDIAWLRYKDKCSIGITLDNISTKIQTGDICVTPVLSDGTDDIDNEIAASVLYDNFYGIELNDNEIIGIKLKVAIESVNEAYSFIYDFFDSIFYETKPEVEFDCDFGDELYIAHAMGGFEKYKYLNCYEAFEYNYYNQGHRVFEVDFSETNDNDLALQHDWEHWNMWVGDQGYGNSNPPSMSEFKSYKIHEKYTPLNWLDLCQIMKEHSDVYVITDTKDDKAQDIQRQFLQLMQSAKENGYEKMLDRLVIQIYNEQMLEIVEKIYPFKHIIFTMYKRWSGDINEYKKICQWCIDNGIGDICMEDRLYKQKDVALVSKLYGIDVYLHTINKKSTAQKRLDLGAKGIYTDFL